MTQIQTNQKLKAVFVQGQNRIQDRHYLTWLQEAKEVILPWVVCLGGGGAITSPLVHGSMEAKRDRHAGTRLEVVARVVERKYDGAYMFPFTISDRKGGITVIQQPVPENDTLCLAVPGVAGNPCRSVIQKTYETAETKLTRNVAYVIGGQGGRMMDLSALGPITNANDASTENQGGAKNIGDRWRAGQ